MMVLTADVSENILLHLCMFDLAQAENDNA